MTPTERSEREAVILALVDFSCFRQHSCTRPCDFCLKEAEAPADKVLAALTAHRKAHPIPDSDDYARVPPNSVREVPATVRHVGRAPVLPLDEGDQPIPDSKWHSDELLRIALGWLQDWGEPGEALRKSPKPYALAVEIRKHLGLPVHDWIVEAAKAQDPAHDPRP